MSWRTAEQLFARCEIARGCFLSNRGLAVPTTYWFSKHIALLLLVILGGVGGVQAQEARPRPSACFRGRPLPACQSFWITESSLLGTLAQNDAFTSTGDPFWSVEVGWVRNVSLTAAVGGGVAFADAYISLRPRYRRWINSATSVDGVFGVRWTPGRVETLEMQVGVTRSDLVGLWTGTVIDLGRGGFGWTGGVKVGSYAGVTTYVLGVAGLTYFLLTFDPD